MSDDRSPSFVLFSGDGPIARLTLNRPERLNAVTEELYIELIDALARLSDDAAVRVVLLRGAGRAFCAGADMKAHAAGERGPSERRRYVELTQEACERIQRLPKPVVAQVHGYALGAGAELCLNADFVLMSDDAQIGFPELSIGTYVTGGITFTLPRLVGVARAKRLLLRGERLSGAQAAEWGLAHDATPAPELEAAAEALAGDLAVLAPVPVRLLKSHLQDTATGDFTSALEQEREAVLECMGTEDWAEGVHAFAQRRRPRFTGS
jgi:enoyl-CoA hydratase